MIDCTACEFRHTWLHAAVVILVAFLLMSQTASAAVEPVGRLISADGDVTAIRAGESARSLDRGDPVYEGDELRTGARATAQVRFSDGGLFALEADTRFAVNQYEAGDDGGGSALMQFLRGALRTITGSIGSRSNDTYRLRTPTATIGVRGTSYALSYCDAECAAGHDGQPGLYGRVGDGEVRVNTPKGVGEFGAGSYFFVPEGGASRAIIKPPKGILEGGADRAREKAGEAIDAAVGSGVLPSREEAAEILQSLGITGVVFESGDTFEAEGESTTGLGGAAVTANGLDGQSAPYNGFEFFPPSGNFSTDDSGNVDGVQFSNDTNVQVTSATLDELDFESDLGVAWGRWSGGFNVNGSPATGNLAFAATDNFTEPTTLASLNGTLDYGNPVGPQAFDNNGGLWTVDALSLGVDFDAVDITLNQFDLSNTTLGALSFTNTDTANLDLSGNGLALTTTSQAGGAAIIGSFVGGAAEGMIVVFTVNPLLLQTVDSINGTKILRQIAP